MTTVCKHLGIFIENDVEICSSGYSLGDITDARYLEGLAACDFEFEVTVNVCHCTVEGTLFHYGSSDYRNSACVHHLTFGQILRISADTQE